MRTKAFAVLALLGLGIAACGGDDAADTTSAPAPAPTEAGAPEPTPTEATTPAPTPTEGETPEGDTIVIGAAIDLTGNMAPFDAPALASAKIAVEQINAAGGVMGKQLELKVIDTKLDEAQTKAAAIDLIQNQGADVLLTTCDVDFATPAIQEGLDAGLLTVAPCIGTDQMGPNRFGDAGRLAFSFGNLAQDEGAVLAEWAIEQGYKSAIVVPDNLLVYFQNVCSAFEKRFVEKGGTIVSNEGFASFDQSVNNVPTIVSGAGAADVIALCTFPPDIATAVSGIRTVAPDTPIVSPWSGDGTFWNGGTNLSNFTFSTFASAFGDDPSAEVNELIKAMTDAGAAPGTGGFITGAATIEAIAAAIETAGTTEGAALAAAFEAFNGLETSSGKITFSANIHTVFGREYRMITFENGTPVFKKLMSASSPADLS